MSPRIALIAGALLACWAAAFPAQAMQAKVEKETAAALQPKCAAGNSASCSSLGVRYDMGDGVAKDHAAALEFYRKGCDGGSRLGCSLLGSAYLDGDGVAKDAAKAAALFDKACTAGSTEDCRRLSGLFWDGNGVKQNRAIANQIMQKACDDGNAHACTAMGARYTTGNSMQVDKAKAAALFEKGCSGGSVMGCGLAGSAYDAGNGVKLDAATAVKFFRKACEGKDAFGCYFLGYYYSKGKGGLPQNHLQAEQHFLAACSGGNGLACSTLGMVYRKGQGVKVDIAKAETFERKGCELKSESCKPATPQSATTTTAKPAASNVTPEKLLAACRSYNDPSLDAKACLALGKARAIGSAGVEKNDAAAFWLLSRSCDFGDAEGCLMTGALYALGRTGLEEAGDRPDPAGATAYYAIACKTDAQYCGTPAVEKATSYLISSGSR